MVVLMRFEGVARCLAKTFLLAVEEIELFVVGIAFDIAVR